MGASAWTKEELGIWPFGPTSANVVGRVLQVLDFINTLHRQIMTSAVSQEFKDAWGGFYRVAANYLVVAQQHPIALSTEDVQARVEAFASQSLAWRQAFESAGGNPVGPAITPETPAESKLPSWLKWVLVAGLAGGGLYVTSLIVRTPGVKEWMFRKSFPKTSPEQARAIVKHGTWAPGD